MSRNTEEQDSTKRRGQLGTVRFRWAPVHSPPCFIGIRQEYTVTRKSVA